MATRVGGGVSVAGEGAARLVAGFVLQPEKLGVRALKHAECRMRIRLAGSFDESNLHNQGNVAAEAGVTTRTMRNYFPRWEAVYAFPPPEMAEAIVAMTTGVARMAAIPTAVRPLFDALDANAEGRVLLTNLVRLRVAHPELRQCDNYFEIEMRTRLAERDGPLEDRHAVLTATFAEALRVALRAWVLYPFATAVDIELTLGEHLRDPVVALADDDDRATGPPR
jgi:AcrR family transcriptional regulator